MTEWVSHQMELILKRGYHFCCIYSPLTQSTYNIFNEILQDSWLRSFSLTRSSLFQNRNMENFQDSNIKFAMRQSKGSDVCMLTGATLVTKLNKVHKAART